jgi:small conductance mechanosensitive channel
MRIIMKITRKTLTKSNADPVVYTFVQNAVKVVCLIVLITMCLGAMGIPMSTVVAVLGAAGAAIALALKDSLANVAGGVMIIITQPFSKDDHIDIGDVSGKVEKIDLFLTTLKIFDNKTITIPNGLINTSVLVNHSKENLRRVDCTFGIGYNNDIGEAKAILRKVCDANPEIFKEPEPLIGVANHGDSAVILDVKVWCETDAYWDVKYFLEENVKLAFDEHGIEIPYPQIDVHIQK